MRGDLRDDQEGSKRCMHCREMRTRSEFVCAVSNSTRQWDARDRQCLSCAKAARAQRTEQVYKWKCGGCGERKGRDAFTRSQLQFKPPTCRDCDITAKALCSGGCAKWLPKRCKACVADKTVLCHGACGERLSKDMFSAKQLNQAAKRCKVCVKSGDRGPAREQVQCHGDCGKRLPKNEFSNKQLEKRVEKPRCKGCIAASVSAYKGWRRHHGRGVLGRRQELGAEYACLPSPPRESIRVSPECSTAGLQQAFSGCNGWVQRVSWMMTMLIIVVIATA
eukprot:gene19486-biopygen23076